MMDVIYSTLPCPNGCFLSAFFLEIFVPIIVTIELPASVKLLTASVMIATELARIPMNALKPTNNMLATIPITLVLTIVFSIPLFIIIAGLIIWRYRRKKK